LLHSVSPIQVDACRGIIAQEREKCKSVLFLKKENGGTGTNPIPPFFAKKIFIFL
jgi:hypothetical protein